MIQIFKKDKKRKKNRILKNFITDIYVRHFYYVGDKYPLDKKNTRYIKKGLRDNLVLTNFQQKRN